MSQLGGAHVDVEEATALAFEFVEAVETGGNDLIEHDDGVIHAPHLVRDGDKLHQHGEPWAWYDLSSEILREEFSDDRAPDDLRIQEKHRVRHQDNPVRRYYGWAETSDGAVLISTEGTSWLAEAYVPSEVNER